MDPDIAGLTRRLARARQVLAFAEAGGDQSAIRIAGTVLVELLDKVEKQSIDTGPDTSQAADPSPSTTGRAA